VLEIALDDSDQRATSDGLLELADIVKVEFAACDEQRHTWCAHELGRRGAVLLAGKIERREDHEQALSLGYYYFQGYFFAQPEGQIGRRAPRSRRIVCNSCAICTSPIRISIGSRVS
jgi:c-di-GMP-related signal transduction protein